MAAESMYDEMPLGDEMDDDGDTAADEKDEPEALDEQFEMHAKDAGFDSPEKAQALKMAIERCVELREQKSYEPEAGEGDEAEEPEV